MKVFWICIIFAGMLLMVSSSSAEIVSVVEETIQRSNLSCAEYETPCGLGCCPFADAVCCLDGYECCEHGKACIPYLGICIGSGSENSLVSSDATRVRSELADCPSFMTECGEGCCPYLEATCCYDGLHCCPHGFSCDVPGKRCVRTSPQYSVLDASNRRRGPRTNQVRPVAEKKMTKSVPKALLKSCPGGTIACPKSQSCCLGDHGGWKCCPKPSYVRGSSGVSLNCCYDWDWNVQCCDEDQFCTLNGCF